MEVIASFQVDHTDLKPGIYISRQDSFGDTTFTTYDIRMTAPNHEPAVNCAALHTIEHLVATYLRNREGWKQNMIYWGPMGCLTGNYLMHDLPMAKWEARRYISRLKNEFCSEYPGLARPTLNGGMTFFDA